MNNKQEKRRLFIKISGAVQGVGFRPFVYRIAAELNLFGWVNNSSIGVLIEVEGTKDALDKFLNRIKTEKPPRAYIQSIETKWLEFTGYNQFEIRPSVGGEKTTVILPDLATCPDCLKDIFDTNNRRYRYPFTNCTNCGPRYTIIEALPYDRCYTTMKGFPMCPACGSEYNNPLDRRFHAQPNACPQCGPHLQLWDKNGTVIATQDRALLKTVAAIRDGKIVAIKGLGGFHLVVDGCNSQAVSLLRQRKCRPDKPFALMYPSLELVKHHCYVISAEEKLLLSPEAPIVLLRVKANKSPHTPLIRETLYLGNSRGNGVSLLPQSPLVKQEKELSFPCPEVAPGNPYLGVMLPYTPLHHLLMAELDFPLVATSGNLADEPICIDEYEALERLNQIADLFLIHNRPIIRPVDDSIVRIVAGRAMVLRRARGYAPFPLSLSPSDTGSKGDSHLPSLLAVGAHFKNTVAITRNHQVFISQHIGNLDSESAFDAFCRVMDSLKGLYNFKAEIIACDAHPDYISSQFAHSQGLPLIKVQHHYAHVLACMAEHQLQPPVLGVAWDGTGYGDDHTIWGGEFISVTEQGYQRAAHFRTFPLPGGEKAVKQPRRIALGLLHELGLDSQLMQSAFTPQEFALVQTMLSKNINTPITSSVGRLFDGIASLLGIRHQATFEGQAAMELEWLTTNIDANLFYPFEVINDSSLSPSPLVIDWAKIIQGILDDFSLKLPLGIISAKFHNTLVEIILEIGKLFGESRLVLTGGCFQNSYLLERAIARLQAENFVVYWHQTIPPNDGGIALGQILAAMRHQGGGKREECFDIVTRQRITDN